MLNYLTHAVFRCLSPFGISGAIFCLERRLYEFRDCLYVDLPIHLKSKSTTAAVRSDLYTGLSFS